jgi:hypothetical protein
MYARLNRDAVRSEARNLREQIMAHRSWDESARRLTLREGVGRRGLLPCSITIGLFTIPLVATGTSATVLTAVACLQIILCIWYTVVEATRYGGVTFTSLFVVISSFVFSARALYIARYQDLELLTLLGFPPTFRPAIVAMGAVVFGTIAFITGGEILKAERMGATERSWSYASLVTEPLGRNCLLLLCVQLGIIFLLAPFGLVGGRNVFYDRFSSSAYLYLLPTLSHGVNLFAFVTILSKWCQSRAAPWAIGSIVSAIFVITTAYILNNMSEFRGFYLVGILVCLVAAGLQFRRRISPWMLVAIILIYPFFKMLGTDRDLTNKEVLLTKVLHPYDGYTDEGLRTAFGPATDINMLDTLAASLYWEHAHRPYVLSYLYVFVHWVPRSWWPGKPENGILDDLGYLVNAQQGNFIPFSPGIIGFFNDDGGVWYMLLMMLALGAFMRYWQKRVALIVDHELFICVWSSLFLSSLVAVRYLPYQIVYSFAVFWVPCVLLNWVMGLKGTREDGIRGGI